MALGLVVSASFAVVGASSARATTTVGTVQVVPGTIELSSVACPSDDVCEALGGDASRRPVLVSLTAGVAGSVQSEPDGVGLARLACPSTSSCVAVGRMSLPPATRSPALPILPPPGQTVGVVVAITDGLLGGVQVVPGTDALDGVSCATVSVCEAVGFSGPNGTVVRITKGVAEAAQPFLATPALGGFVQFDAVSCASVTACEAVGQSGAFGLSGLVVGLVDGTPLAAQVIRGVDAELDGVSCPAITQCEAVGNGAGKAVVVPITNGAAGGALALPDVDRLNDVACATPSVCQAVGGTADLHGAVVTITDGVPGGAVLVMGTEQLVGVACASPASCTAVGASTFLVLGQGEVVPITSGAVPVTTTTTAPPATTTSTSTVPTPTTARPPTTQVGPLALTGGNEAGSLAVGGALIVMGYGLRRRRRGTHR